MLKVIDLPELIKCKKFFEEIKITDDIESSLMIRKENMNKKHLRVFKQSEMKPFYSPILVRLHVCSV